MASISMSSSAKLVLVSTGILSVAVAVAASAPAVAHFYLHQAPAIWSSLNAWLRPPYIYLVINFIIITIAVSSRFHVAGGIQHHPPQPQEEPVEEQGFGGVVRAVGPTPEAEEYVNIGADVGVGPAPAAVGEEMVTWVAPVDYSPEKMDSPETEELQDAVVSYSASPAAVDDKPLVSLSARFGHRKPVRSPYEGARALRVSRPKRQETLESTWKKITEGRPMRLTRYLKKAETFCDNNNNHTNGHKFNVDQAAVVRKSETFRERTNQQLPPVAASKLRKESSLSQDELNRRVEAFIRKFNEEMRLQRQQSLNQYKEMINNGGLS